MNVEPRTILTLQTFPHTQILSEHAQCRDFRSPPESFSCAKTFQTHFTIGILLRSRPGQFYENRCKHGDLALLVGFLSCIWSVRACRRRIVRKRSAVLSCCFNSSAELRFQTPPSLSGSQSPSFSLDTLPVNGFLGTIVSAFFRPPSG